MGGQSKVQPCRPPLKAFSTTGRGDAAASQASKRGVQQRSVQEQPAVAMLRMGKREGLPERLLLGGGWPCTVTIGRHSDNEAVLMLRSASKVHCQIALRGFRLPGHAEGHEAAFLRDNSRNGTMVNGVPAFRPWHWLQSGDYIGIRDGRGKAENLVDLYRVEYCSHRRLPGHSITLEGEDPSPLWPQPAESQTATGPVASRAVLGSEVCGRVVDVHYKDQDPPATYRMRIMGFNKRTGWHHCDSAGLDTWDGESFDDTLDLNLMYKEGNIVFVDEEGEHDEGSEEECSELAPRLLPPPPPPRPPHRKRRRSG